MLIVEELMAKSNNALMAFGIAVMVIVSVTVVIQLKSPVLVPPLPTTRHPVLLAISIGAVKPEIRLGVLP